MKQLYLSKIEFLNAYMDKFFLQFDEQQLQPCRVDLLKKKKKEFHIVEHNLRKHNFFIDMIWIFVFQLLLMHIF